MKLPTGSALARLFATILSTRVGASCSNAGITDASGRFFQYFFGISVFIALVFTRAGLKMRE
jgi:hypothetical protein